MARGKKTWSSFLLSCAAVFAQIRSGRRTHPYSFPQFITTSTSEGIHKINPAPLPRPSAHMFFPCDFSTTDRLEVLALPPSVDPALATPPLLLSEPGPCFVVGAVPLRSMTHSLVPKIAVRRKSVACMTTGYVTFPDTDWSLPKLSSDDATRWIACSRSVPPPPSLSRILSSCLG